MRLNSFGQPVGDPVNNWSPRPVPDLRVITGNHCILVPLGPEHFETLFSLYQKDGDAGWTYLPDDPPENIVEFSSIMYRSVITPGRYPYVILDRATGLPVGMTSLFNVNQEHGSLEIGRVHYTSQMSRRPITTECQWLLLHVVFDCLGYRRCEWTCDTANEASRKTALRLGYKFEGTRRNCIVRKGRNQDKDWFSVTDYEWPLLNSAFQAWLAPSNFTAKGTQIRKLEVIRVQMQTETNHNPANAPTGATIQSSGQGNDPRMGPQTHVLAPINGIAQNPMYTSAHSLIHVPTSAKCQVQSPIHGPTLALRPGPANSHLPSPIHCPAPSPIHGTTQTPAKCHKHSLSQAPSHGSAACSTDRHCSTSPASTHDTHGPHASLTRPHSGLASGSSQIEASDDSAATPSGSDTDLKRRTRNPTAGSKESDSAERIPKEEEAATTDSSGRPIEVCQHCGRTFKGHKTSTHKQQHIKRMHPEFYQVKKRVRLEHKFEKQPGP